MDSLSKHTHTALLHSSKMLYQRAKVEVERRRKSKKVRGLRSERRGE